MEIKKVNRPKLPSSPIRPIPTAPAAHKNVIVGAEQVVPKNVPPKKYKAIIFGLIGAIMVVLTVVAIILIAIYPTPKRPLDISLQFNVSTSIAIERDPEMQTEMKVMPGDTVECVFNLETLPDEDTQDVNNDVFLRIRAYVISESNYYTNVVSLNFIDGNKWFKGADGYYYFQKNNDSDGVLSVGEKLTITKSFYIDTSTGNEFAGKSIIVQFDAEVLQAHYQAIEEIWPTAPWEWASQYRELV